MPSPRKHGKGTKRDAILAAAGELLCWRHTSWSWSGCSSRASAPAPANSEPNCRPDDYPWGPELQRA